MILGNNIVLYSNSLFVLLNSNNTIIDNFYKKYNRRIYN